MLSFFGEGFSAGLKPSPAWVCATPLLSCDECDGGSK